MTVLHLGVVDVAYSGGDGKTTTTGDVAEILEDKYHVMRSFLETNEDFIGQMLADGVAGAIETMAMGRAPRQLTFNTDKINERFRNFLSGGEMQRLMPATQPIKAAEAGVNHRKKHPNKKDNKPRKAFIDTGLYQASFRSWVTE